MDKYVRKTSLRSNSIDPLKSLYSNRIDTTILRASQSVVGPEIISSKHTSDFDYSVFKSNDTVPRIYSGTSSNIPVSVNLDDEEESVDATDVSDMRASNFLMMSEDRGKGI